MKEMKYKSNEQGVCPVCGSTNLSWGDSECVGDYMYYNWSCLDCQTEGQEWYELVFRGHEVSMQTINENGYSEYHYDSVNEYIEP